LMRGLAVFRLAALLLVLAVAVPGPAAAQLSFFGLKNKLIDFALSQVNVPGSLEISVTKVESPDDGATDLIGVAIADSDGVWLRIGRVSMNWDPSRLTSGQVSVTKLVADDVEVLRQPKPGPPEAPAAKTDDAGPKSLVWPRSPISVVVAGMQLNRVQIAGGVVGPSPLAFNASGQFKDEGDEQSARIALDRTDSVVGTIRFDYRRNFATELLRLVLDAKEAPGGVVAELAGLPPGSATVVHVEGDGPVLNWAADLRAKIDDIGLVEGQVQIASVQPLDLKLDVKAAAEGQMRTTGGPLLAEPVGLQADLVVAESGLLTLRRIAVDSQIGRVEASGSFDTNSGELDAKVEADLPRLGPPEIDGVTVTGVHFLGQVGGKVDALTGSGAFALASLAADGVAANGVALDATFGLDGETVRFDLKSRAAGLKADRLDLAGTQGVAFDLAGVLEGQEATLSRFVLTGPVVEAKASGTASLADGPLALAYQVRIPDLSPVAAAYDAKAAGRIVSEGKLSGTLAAPRLDAFTAAEQLAMDGQALGDVRVQHDVVVAEAVSGKVTIDAATKLYGKLRAETDLVLAGETLTLTKLQADGMGVQVRSPKPLSVDLAKTLIDGRIAWSAGNLASLARLAGAPMAGKAAGDVVFKPQQGRQNLTVNAKLERGKVGDAAVSLLTVKAAIRDALGLVPGVDASVHGETITAGDVEITPVDLTVKGPLNALAVSGSLAGTAPDGKPLTGEWAATVDVLKAPISATISTLIARYAKEEVRLTAPLKLTSGNGRTRMDGLALAVPGGTVSGDAEVRGQALLAALAVKVPDITRLATLAGVPIEAGSIDASIDYDSRKSARVFADITNLRMADLPTGAEALTVQLRSFWDGKEARASVQVGGGFGEPIHADVVAPVKPSGSFVPKPAPTAPLAGQVLWSGRAERLWSLVPAADHYLAGQVDIDLRIGGTIGGPSVSGRSDITDGRYENLEAGTVLTKLQAKSQVAADGGFLVTVDARDPVGAPVSAQIEVHGKDLDAKITTQKALLVRREDVTATVTANITATGTLLRPVVAGDILIDRAEVRLVHAMPPSIADLGDVQIKGAPKPRTKPAEDGRIALDMRVHAPDSIFVRGRGLDSEWRMALVVGGTAKKPRVTGAISKIRGQLTLLGKPFDLDRGEVRFADTARIDPALDVALIREANGIKGGITVTGPASASKVEFVSTPQLPKGEVMPRLLFDQSSQSLSPLQALDLASGIATLLDGSGGTLDRVRNAVGLDVLRVEDKGAGTGVTVGKTVAPGVFVGANQPIDGSAPSARVEIEVFENVIVESDLGQQSGSSIGVKWRTDF
jgi:translocation and assembly module TamB